MQCACFSDAEQHEPPGNDGFGCAFLLAVHSLKCTAPCGTRPRRCALRLHECLVFAYLHFVSYWRLTSKLRVAPTRTKKAYVVQRVFLDLIVWKFNLSFDQNIHCSKCFRLDTSDTRRVMGRSLGNYVLRETFSPLPLQKSLYLRGKAVRCAAACCEYELQLQAAHRPVPIGLHILPKRQLDGYACAAMVACHRRQHREVLASKQLVMLHRQKVTNYLWMMMMMVMMEMMKIQMKKKTLKSLKVLKQRSKMKKKSLKTSSKKRQFKMSDMVT